MKEKEKILIAKSLLKVTFIMICISAGLKLLGLNIFEADRDNKILLWIGIILENNKYIDLGYSFLLSIIQNYIILRISTDNKGRKIHYLAAIIITFLAYFLQWYMNVQLNLVESQSSMIYFIYSFLALIFTTLIIDLKIKSNKNKAKTFSIKIWNKIKKILLIIIVINIYQFLVMFLRNITYVETYDSIYNLLLNFDYSILLFTTYFLFLKKESNIKLKPIFNFSLPKIFDERLSIDTVRTLVSEFKDKINNFKKTDRTEKIVIIIYIFFVVLSELFNLCLVIFVASLNYVLVECFFVVSSFLISRKVFGSFHFDSAWKCWLVSNISFFILNKLTLNVNITFVIPILCGISLAYITSKFIKKTITTPYRGMTEQELINICKNKSLNKFEMDLLVDFYCRRESIVKLTYKYNYSQTAIVRFKRTAMNKLIV